MGDVEESRVARGCPSRDAGLVPTVGEALQWFTVCESF
jgi:hypothetical protein